MPADVVVLCGDTLAIDMTSSAESGREEGVIESGSCTFQCTRTAPPLIGARAAMALLGQPKRDLTDWSRVTWRDWKQTSGIRSIDWCQTSEQAASTFTCESSPQHIIHHHVEENPRRSNRQAHRRRRPSLTLTTCRSSPGVSRPPEQLQNDDH